MVTMNKKLSIFAVVLTFLILNWANCLAAEDFNYLSVVNPIDSKSDLYQQILDEMNSEYETIGKREAARVLQNSTTSVTGGLNSIGFSYRKPFVDFSIIVDRNLSPELNSDRWIVRDTFSIFIDASKVISHLKDQKVLDITDKNLAAFAGVVFKRTYTWVHFADNYNDGLTLHFEKLFMPFKALEFNNVKNLQSNEIVLKEDSLSFNAGGLVTTPLYTGVTAMAGVLAKFEKLSRVEVISMPSLQTGSPDNVLLSYEKSKVTTAGFSMGIQADFLNILKMTLLSYDFSYQLNSSYKISLNLSQNVLSEMQPTNPVAIEIGEILKNREGNLLVLAPYIVSEEKRLAETVAHKYNFLLLGGSKSSQTQQIEITTDGKVKNFFRHYYEKVKYTENLFSRIFASFIYALTNSDISAGKLASDSKKVTIEYDSERNLLENHEDLSIKENEQKLSMTFSSEFMTNKSAGTGGKKYRDRALFVLERFSGVAPMAIDMLGRDYLVAPLKINGQFQVNTEGIRYLNSLSVGSVFDYVDGLCNEYPKTSFIDFRNLFDHCRRSLQNDYIDYYKDLSHQKVTADAITVCEARSKHFIFSPAKSRAFLKNCLGQLTYKDKENWSEIPLWQLKTLSNNIVNNSYSKVHYFNLFGIQNVFFYGSFNAMTTDGRDFVTSFHEGAFKGLGAVDHYMRLENLRAPSSVVVDEQ